MSCLPDHSFKQVLNDKVGLSYHNQQGHMGPSKLEWQTQNTNTTVSLHWNVAVPAQKLARVRK